MQFLLMALFSVGIVIADQITKFLVVENIALYADVPFLPGIVQLTYVQNTGAAFSALEGQQWLFALIFIVFTAAVLILGVWLMLSPGGASRLTEVIAGVSLAVKGAELVLGALRESKPTIKKRKERENGDIEADFVDKSDEL